MIYAYGLLFVCVVVAWRNVLRLPTHVQHQDKGAAILWLLIALVIPAGAIKLYGMQFTHLLCVLLLIIVNSLLLQAAAFWRGASLFDNLGR